MWYITVGFLFAKWERMGSVKTIASGPPFLSGRLLGFLKGDWGGLNRITSKTPPSDRLSNQFDSTQCTDFILCQTEDCL